MAFSAPFLKRPVATTLLAVAIVIAGWLGYRSLPVAALPTIDFPVIEVSANLPGATADTMATSVTSPLEGRLSGIPGVEALTAVSSAGSTSITLRFALDRDIDDAAQDVQAALSAAASQLPPELPDPPVYRKINPADPPIITLALVSGTLPPDQTSRYAETLLVPRLSQIDGVGAVQVLGARQRAVRVSLDPNAISALGLSIEDVRAQIAAASVSGPKGKIEGQAQAFAIGANDQLLAASEYESLFIRTATGSLVRLRDIGRAVDQTENATLAAWTDGQPAILLEIHRQAGANTIETARRVRERLPELSAALPATAELRMLTDMSETIQASIDHTWIALFLSVLLVTGLLWFFLRQPTAVLIPAIVLPLSLIGTLVAMDVAGLSLNILTLMALAVAAGFVVDDAIVMVENITRHLEDGASPFEAALNGSRQITFTIISLTVSIIAVFIPLIWMDGTVGRLLQEFGLTVSFAVGISAVLSLTLTPAMCAWLLRKGGGEHEQVTAPALDFYARYLKASLARPAVTLWSLAGLIALTVVLMFAMPKGFLPTQGSDRIEALTEMAGGTSFEAATERHRALVARLKSDPAVAGIESSVGDTTRGRPANIGQLTIRLKPGEGHGSSMNRIIERLRTIAAEEPGIALFMHPVQPLQLQDRVSHARHQFLLQGPRAEGVRDAAQRLVAALGDRPELIDLAWDGQEVGRGVEIRIDRDRALLLGISMAAVDNSLYSAFGQRQIANIYSPEGEYPVVLEFDASARRDLAALDELYIRGAQGLVPLSAIADWRETDIPLSVVRFGRFPARAVSFDVAPGYSLGDAVSAIEDEVEELDLPAEISGEFTGDAEAVRGSLTNQLALIFGAIIVMYIALGVLYESFVHPLTILSTLPAAAAGGLVVLAITGHELDLMALLGILLLIGIVKKNAILMIDFAREASRRKQASPEEAIYEASLVRFRPILMTTFAALLGAVPLILDPGAGAELRRPIGFAMIGGLMVAQVLTLFSTPVLYSLFARMGAWTQARIERTGASLNAEAASGTEAGAGQG